MKPEVASMCKTAQSSFRKAQGSLLAGDHVTVIAECKNAIWSACAAIKLAGFGDARSTFAGLFRAFPSRPDEAIRKTRDTLEAFEKMAPSEDPLFFT